MDHLQCLRGIDGFGILCHAPRLVTTGSACRAGLSPGRDAPGSQSGPRAQRTGRTAQEETGPHAVLMRMAQIEREKGKLDEATAHLREVIKNEPANAEAHLELGRNLYEKGDVQGGIAETQQVLKIDPRQVDALYNLGAIYANLGNPGE